MHIFRRNLPSHHWIKSLAQNRVLYKSLSLIRVTQRDFTTFAFLGYEMNFQVLFFMMKSYSLRITDFHYLTLSLDIASR